MIEYSNVTDLCTRDEVKAYLDITDSASDSLIDTLIDSASQAIANYIQRDIGSKSRTEVRSGNNRSFIQVLEWPITAVSSVTINNVAVPASSGYGIAGYTFDSQKIALIGRVFDAGMDNVTLVYTAGYASIPAVVSRAAVYTAATMYNASGVDWNMGSEAVPGVYSASYLPGGGSLPEQAMLMLNPWRRLFWP